MQMELVVRKRLAKQFGAQLSKGAGLSSNKNSHWQTTPSCKVVTEPLHFRVAALLGADRSQCPFADGLCCAASCAVFLPTFVLLEGDRALAGFDGQPTE